MTVAAKKQCVFWLTILILQVLLVAWFQGLLSPERIQPAPDDLVMSKTEARLVRAAISLVQEDLEAGTWRTSERVLAALSAELPESVRGRVMSELGTPSLDEMRDALDVLSGKIQER